MGIVAGFAEDGSTTSRLKLVGEAASDDLLNRPEGLAGRSAARVLEEIDDDPDRVRGVADRVVASAAVNAVSLTLCRQEQVIADAAGKPIKPCPPSRVSSPSDPKSRPGPRLPEAHRCRSPEKPVIAVAAAKAIVPPAAGEFVSASVAGELIVARQAEEVIVPAIALKEVVADTPEKPVTAGAAAEDVIARAAESLSSPASPESWSPPVRPNRSSSPRPPRSESLSRPPLKCHANHRRKGRPHHSARGACLSPRRRGSIDALAAAQNVVRPTAGKEVVAKLPEELVSALAAADRVDAIAAAENVVRPTAEKEVVANPPEEPVLALTTADLVDALAAEGPVVPATTKNPVVTVTPGQAIVTRGAGEAVVAATAENEIQLAQSVKLVCRALPDD